MLAHMLNCILLFDYKFTLPKYDLISTQFVGLEVYAVGNLAS